MEPPTLHVYTKYAVLAYGNLKTALYPWRIRFFLQRKTASSEQRESTIAGNWLDEDEPLEDQKLVVCETRLGGVLKTTNALLPEQDRSISSYQATPKTTLATKPNSLAAGLQFG